MGFLGDQNFSFISSGGGGTPPATPNWQAVTAAGNTTTNDIFVKDGSGNDYLRVSPSANSYFLGDGVNLRGVVIDANGQRYQFGDLSSGLVVAIIGSGTPQMNFAGITLYQFPDGIAPYASGLYQAVVLNTDSAPNALEIQPKDMLPISVMANSHPLTPAQSIVLVDSTAGVIALTLNNASYLPGKRFFIKYSAGGNNITITPSSGNIDGGALFTLSTLYESIEVYFDGTDYWII